MGFLDDDSSSCMSDDMSCSNISISFVGSRARTATGGGYLGNMLGKAAPPPPKDKFKFSWDDSSCSLMNSRSNLGKDNKAKFESSFKFSWEDSGISCATEDLEESDSSFLQLGNYRRDNNVKKATPLGKMLEQVDGVKYKEKPSFDWAAYAEQQKKEDVPNNTRRNRSNTLLGFDSDSEEDEDTRFYTKLERHRDSLVMPNNTRRNGSNTLLGFDSDSEEEDDLMFLPPVAKKKVPSKPPAPPTRKITIKFEEPLVTSQLEYVQEEDAVCNVWDDKHEAQDHNQIPWDEEDYEELPWHLQPDMDEDDEITKFVKDVILGEERRQELEDDDCEEELELEVQRRVDRVEGWVIFFALKLKNARVQRQIDLVKGKDGTEESLDGGNQ